MSKSLARVFALAVVAAVWAAGLAAPLAEEPEAGKALFEKKCAMCHGKNGVAKPMADGSADLNDPRWQRSTSVEAIVKITTEGKGKMPGYGDKLEADEIRAIATYVKRLK